jgi:predicted ATP-grasp superfamily ATP-dependent carboligase
MQPEQTSSHRRLLIIGASARSAAWSAWRAGYAPAAIDCFADRDLMARASCRRVTAYPRGLGSAARQFSEMPWMYVGALENQPQIIDQIARHRELLGNGGEVVRRARDPWRFATAVQKAGFKTPETTLSPPAGKELWLQKRFHSAAGLGVARWNAAPSASQGVYYQQFIDGTLWSSLHLGANRDAMLLSVQRQWAGAAELGAREFLYCGSFTTPPDHYPIPRDQLDALGRVLADAFGLVGLFGVDWIFAEGTIWPLEVNPRYTASCEVVEWSTNWPLIDWHVRACRTHTLPQLPNASQAEICGKGILYSLERGTATAALSQFVDQLNIGRSWPVVADIPATGEPLLPGHPIVTLFARGVSLDDVQAQIIELAGAVRRLLTS